MNARTALFAFAILMVAGWNSTAHAVLQAYWKFDETAGSTAANSSGSVTNYNGTLTNFVTDDSQWQPGRFGNALQFKNTTTPVVDTNDVVLLNSNVVDLGTDWTISAWFIAPLTNDNWHTLTRGSNDHQVIFEANAIHNLGTYQNVGVGAGFHPASPAFPGNSLSVGFHQLVAVGAGTTTTFYVDGAQVGISNYKSETDIFALGNYQGGTQVFTDLLDDMGVFDQALTDAEAKSIFNLAMQPELDYDLGEANQLIQAFENSAPSIQIGDQLWTLITDGSISSPEGTVATNVLNYQYAINYLNGNGFAVVLVAPEPSSLLLGTMGCMVLLSRRRRNRGK